jgi:hypothetical protein
VAGEACEERVRQRRAVFARRGHDPEVGEEHRLGGARILHGEDVAAQRDTRRLAGGDVQAAVAQPADDGAGRGGLPRIHAGAGQGDDRHAAEIEVAAPTERRGADPRRHADPLAEIGKMQHRAQHLAVERLADFRVHGVADAEHPADVQDLHAGSD